MCQRPIKSNPAIYSQYRLALLDCLLQVLAVRPGVLFYASLSAVSLRQRHLRGECMRDHELVLGLAELIKAGPEAAEAQGADRSTYERVGQHRLSRDAPLDHSGGEPFTLTAGLPTLGGLGWSQATRPGQVGRYSLHGRLRRRHQRHHRHVNAVPKGKAPVRSSAQVLPRKSPLPTENHEQAPQIR